ncbi:MAG: hypothetical protein JNL90_17410 [Planctomycetes bacterium]|nr:hypothetical protein [Planctomycetota bacterium]
MRLRRSTTFVTLRATAPLLLLASAACGRRFEAARLPAPGGSNPPPVDPPIAVIETGAARFGGVAGLTPLADGFVVEWEPLRLDDGSADPNFAYDLFATLDGSSPDVDGVPTLTTAPGAERATLAGLALGTRLHVAVRAFELAPGGSLDRNPVVLSGEVRPLFWIDAAAGGGGDGSAPDRPLQRINDAVGAAFVSGGNFLLAEGTYVEEVALFGGMHLYGGYPTGFTSDERAAQRTVIAPADGAAVAIRLFSSSKPTTVDRVELAGGGTVRNGLDLRDADLQLARVAISGFAAEGIALSSRQRVSQLRFQQLVVSGCGAEGMQAQGSVDALFAQASFLGNAHEGLEFDDLTAEPNETSVLRLWRCNGSGNGEEGLDADLDELDPLSGTSSNDGEIEVVLDASAFEENGSDGVLLDIDYDAADGLFARALLRDCRFRGNGGYGLQLDGDQAGLYVLSGNRVSANRLGGVLAGSDSPDGGRALYLAANHVDLGNGGSGWQVVGPADTALSHFVSLGANGAALAGNGALRCANGAFWNGGAPQTAAVEWSLLAGGGRGCFSGPLEFAATPRATFFTAAADGADRVRVPSGVAVALGDFLELDDDDVAREVVALAGDRALFSPPRAGGVPAATFVALLPGNSASEDFTLRAGSSWRDRGDPLERDRDDSTTDVGRDGGLLADFAPTAARRLPFVVEALLPGGGVAAVAPTALEVRFTRAVRASSVDAASFAVTLDGNPVAGSRSVAGDTLRFVPAAPFASGALEVALSAELQADADGSPLALPLRSTLVLP